MSVERVHHGRHDVVGHGLVYFAGELDELGAEIKFLGLPGKIKGIDRDAVAAQSGTGVEGMKAKGLGRSRIDDLPDVQAHAQTQQLQLVDQSNVDAAVNVLEQLGHLGCSR